MTANSPIAPEPAARSAPAARPSAPGGHETHLEWTDPVWLEWFHDRCEEQRQWDVPLSARTDA